MGGFRPVFMVLIVDKESVQIMTFAKFLYVTIILLEIYRVEFTEQDTKINGLQNQLVCDILFKEVFLCFENLVVL